MAGSSVAPAQGDALEDVASSILAGDDAELALLECVANQELAGVPRKETGLTLVHLAASQGRLQILETLLRTNGGRRAAKLHAGMSNMIPLHLASAHGHHTVLATLLAQSDINAQDARGYSALHHASSRGHVEACRVLLTSHPGCDLEASTANGETALALAALAKQVEVSHILLQAGALLSACQDPTDHAFVLRVAAELAGELQPGVLAAELSEVPPSRSFPDLEPAPVSDGLKNLGSTLILAAGAGDLGSVQWLLAARGSPSEREEQDDRGWTALHHAAWKGHVKVCQALLAGGCPPNAFNAHGECPMGLAAMERHGLVVQTLFDAGAVIQQLTSTADIAFVVEVVGPAATIQVLKLKGALDALEAELSENSSVVSNDLSDDSPQSTIRRKFGASARRDSLLKNSMDTSAQAARRNWPMWVNVGSYNSADGVEPVPAASGGKLRWELMQLGTAGLWYDPDTKLVFWQPHEGPDREEQRGSLSMESSMQSMSDSIASRSGKAPKPLLPVLVGKLLPGQGHVDAPGQGRVVALGPDDAVTVELSRPALRCLRRSSPAAEALTKWAHGRIAGLTVDLAPELGAAPFARGVSLAAPLCGVLGVREVAELLQLNARDLTTCGVDAAFLPAITKAARLHLERAAKHAAGSTPLASTLPRGTTQFATDTTLRASQGSPHTGRATGVSLHGLRGQRRPVTSSGADEGLADGPLPSLVDLLSKHALLKLLPLAVEQGLLAPWSERRWHLLGESADAEMAPRCQVSGVEWGRLRVLLEEVAAVQGRAAMAEADKSQQLSRLTAGNIVIYEADPVKAEQRGVKLVGVLLEDKGDKGSANRQYKVRDLLDDSLSWLGQSQLRRMTPGEGLQYLRADLLPPATQGTPVTPHTAVAGLPVQFASWKWTPVATEKGVGSLAASRGELPGMSDKVVGILVALVSTNTAATKGQVWTVSWPGGLLRDHSIGAGGCFDIVHLQLHRQAGAPVKNIHMESEGVLPVVRAPLWPFATTDDEVPGSLGLAMVIDGGELKVVWSRGRTKEPSTYRQSEQGLFPLCHGLLGGAVLTSMVAWSGVQAEPGPGADKELVALGFQGQGTLLAPVCLSEAGGVVWRLRWPGGKITEHDLPSSAANPGTAVLLVAHGNAQLRGECGVPLTELTPASAATRGTAAAATLRYSTAAAGKAMTGKVLTTAMGTGSIKLGRQLFLQNRFAIAPRSGMLGTLVKLNLPALDLQPRCDLGPLKSHQPRTVEQVRMSMSARKHLPPEQVDDVGLVVRDAGAGAWRGLLVRKLGSTAAFWYDEAVLLPATDTDVRKQASRHEGADWGVPFKLTGVIVTDANAAPGMLVQRAFLEGAAHAGSKKSYMVGTLWKPAKRAHRWHVQWTDGNTNCYKTGFANRFQLQFVNLHARAGAPLCIDSVVSLADQQEAGSTSKIRITAGPHSVVDGAPDQLQSLDLSQCSTSMSHTTQAAGLVTTSKGQSRLAGGPLRLYELSHGIKSGDAVTVFTAKRGTRVMRADSADAEGQEEEEASPLQGTLTPGQARKGKSLDPALIGVLLRPVRLALVTSSKSAAGSKGKARGGCGEPILDSERCSWEVQWPNGDTEELEVGLQITHTVLRHVEARPASGGGGWQAEQRQIALLGAAVKKCVVGLISQEPGLTLQLSSLHSMIQFRCIPEAVTRINEEIIRAAEVIANLQRYDPDMTDAADGTALLDKLISGQATLQAAKEAADYAWRWALSQVPAMARKDLGQVAGAKLTEEESQACKVAADARDAAEEAAQQLGTASVLSSMAVLTMALNLTVTARARLAKERQSLQQLAHESRNGAGDGDEDEEDGAKGSSQASVKEATALASVLERAIHFLVNMQAGLLPSMQGFATVHTQLARTSYRVGFMAAITAADLLSKSCLPLQEAWGRTCEELQSGGLLSSNDRKLLQDKLSCIGDTLLPALAQYRRNAAALPADICAPAESLTYPTEDADQTTWVFLGTAAKDVQGSLGDAAGLLQQLQEASSRVQQPQGSSNGSEGADKAATGMSGVLFTAKLAALAQSMLAAQPLDVPGMKVQADSLERQLEGLVDAGRDAELAALKEQEAQQTRAGMSPALVMMKENLQMCQDSPKPAESGQYARQALQLWPQVYKSLGTTPADSPVKMGMQAAGDTARAVHEPFSIDNKITPYTIWYTNGPDMLSIADGQKAENSGAADLSTTAKAVQTAMELPLHQLRTGMAVKLCKALACDWAAKMLDKLTDPEDLTSTEATRVYEFHQQVAARLPAGSPKTHVPVAWARHPDIVVAGLVALMEPLRLAAPLCQQVGQDAGLDEMENAFNDIFTRAKEAAKDRIQQGTSNVEDISDQLAMQGDDTNVHEEENEQDDSNAGSDNEEEAKGAKKGKKGAGSTTPLSYVCQALGHAQAAEDTLHCTKALIALVPLVLTPPELLETLKGLTEECSALSKQVQQLQHETLGGASLSGSSRPGHPALDLVYRDVGLLRATARLVLQGLGPESAQSASNALFASSKQQGTSKRSGAAQQQNMEEGAEVPVAVLMLLPINPKSKQSKKITARYNQVWDGLFDDKLLHDLLKSIGQLQSSFVRTDGQLREAASRSTSVSMSKAVAAMQDHLRSDGVDAFQAAVQAAVQQLPPLYMC